MRLLSFFRNGRLKPSWEYQARGIIWRILFSDSGRITGEDRDPEGKTVSFFGLDARSGRVLWQDVRLDEPWWISMGAIHHDVLLINEFVKPDLPEHGRIYAVDVETGRLLWSNADIKMLFVSESHVYASRETFQRTLYSALDLRTGRTASDFGTDEAPVMLAKQRGRATLEETLIFPEALTEQSGEFARIHSIVSRRIGEGQLKGSVEFIKTGKYFLLSFYHYGDAKARIEDGLTDNRLLVVESDSGTVVFEDRLNVGVSSPVPDSFFVKDSILYFIRSKRLLVAVRLES